jgi:hypothetical protein
MSQSFARRVYCSACCSAVDAVITEVATAGAGALLGALVGAAHETTKRRPSTEALVAKAVVFGLVGHLAQQALPKVQQLACPNCGCTHLSSAA